MRTASFVLAAMLIPHLWAAEPSAGKSTSQEPVESDFDPDRPPPPLPIEAIITGPHSLELTITATRDGSVRDVKVSKRSKLKELDEYTRKWVELKWKMPAAKPEEPDLRTFIAPFVYPKGGTWPKGGKFPAPPYPPGILIMRQEGIVVLDIVF